MTPEGPAAAVLAAWAVVDVLQVPLVGAVLLSVRLSRRVGAAWKAVAICFGAYTGWVVLTARVVPGSPSGLLVLLFGLLLDPRRDASAERTWALGASVAAALFWAAPVTLAWRCRRTRPRTSAR